MNCLITAKGLTKNYGRFRAVDHVDFQIRPGRVVGLVGPNGAGKS
ncbi:MAG: ATP-binding cassette domain-containing protein, partial [Gammaproteobacteria bacterium]|nr:ATP-binding cassette domain-containing protein [Gammaproteobacteria bacterium]